MDSHPLQCASYLETWTLKKKREAITHAEILLCLSAPYSKKKLTVNDFLPSFAKPKKRKLSPEESEMQLQSYLKGLAAQSKKT
jgi:hypothetical protein